MTKPGTERKAKGVLHIVFTAKGGVGKSYVSSLLAQYADSSGEPMRVLDLDQSNAMLARLPDLKAETVDLLTDSKFDDAKLDKIVRRMMTEPDTYLIDIGASTFQDVWRYFFENQVLELLRDEGVRVVVHCVLVGGVELPDTLSSFSQVAKKVSGRDVIVWLNPLRGPVTANGKSFSEMKAFEDHKAKILAIVALPTPDDAVMTELRSLGLMRKTLLGVDSVDELDFLSKHRLKRHRDQIFKSIGDVWGDINGQSIENA